MSHGLSCLNPNRKGYVVHLQTVKKKIKSKYLFHLLLLHYPLIEIQHHINRLKCHLHSFKRGFPTLDAVKKQHFSMTKWSQKIKSPIQRGLSQRAQCPEGRLRSKNRMRAKNSDIMAPTDHQMIWHSVSGK